MIEALACGTPVIAWPHGSVPEVIEEGKTGYLVETIGEAVEAVARVPNLSRAACRRAFEDRFEAEHMARQYEKVYRRLVQGSSSRAMPQVAEGLVHG